LSSWTGANVGVTEERDEGAASGPREQGGIRGHLGHLEPRISLAAADFNYMAIPARLLRREICDRPLIVCRLLGEEGEPCLLPKAVYGP
jgi:hypothetical protein